MSGFQQIQVQEKWIKNGPNQRGKIRNLSFEYREIWERYAGYVSSLTSKQTNKMNEMSSDRRPKQRGRNLKFALNRYIAMKEGKKERKKGKDWWNHVISVNFEWFPANPSQILPAFCQDNKVKPWNLKKKITKIIVRLT
mgnify:CR=1 FL=1